MKRDRAQVCSGVSFVPTYNPFWVAQCSSAIMIDQDRKCDEKKKSILYHSCVGERRRCVLCGQVVCEYHGCINEKGVKGGHAGCRGRCHTSRLLTHMCSGHMQYCKGCKLSYCGYHFQAAGRGRVNVDILAQSRAKHLRVFARTVLARSSSVLAVATIFVSTMLFRRQCPNRHNRRARMRGDNNLRCHRQLRWADGCTCLGWSSLGGGHRRNRWYGRGGSNGCVVRCDCGTGY